jgi:hypothetical protein
MHNLLERVYERKVPPAIERLWSFFDIFGFRPLVAPPSVGRQIILRAMLNRPVRSYRQPIGTSHAQENKFACRGSDVLCHLNDSNHQWPFSLCDAKAGNNVVSAESTFAHPLPGRSRDLILSQEVRYSVAATDVTLVASALRWR